MRIEKKIIENKAEYASKSVFDFGWWITAVHFQWPMHGVIEILDFFSKITHLPECINACGCLFMNSWKYLRTQIEKKIIENKAEYASESIFDFGAWHEARVRRDRTPFDHKFSRLHDSIRGECFHLHSCSHISEKTHNRWRCYQHFIKVIMED